MKPLHPPPHKLQRNEKYYLLISVIELILVCAGGGEVSGSGFGVAVNLLVSLLSSPA